MLKIRLKLLGMLPRRPDIVQNFANHIKWILFCCLKVAYTHLEPHEHAHNTLVMLCQLGFVKSFHLIELHLQLFERGPRRPEIIQNLAHDVKVCLFWLLRPLNRLIVQVCKGLMTVLLPSLLLHPLLLQLQMQGYLLRAAVREDSRSLAL